MCFLRYVCFKSKIYILIFVLKKIGVFKVAIIFFFYNNGYINMWSNHKNIGLVVTQQPLWKRQSGSTVQT